MSVDRVDFNDLKNARLYCLSYIDCTYNRIEYKEGLNKDLLPFNFTNGDGPGGMYFFHRKTAY